MRWRKLVGWGYRYAFAYSLPSIEMRAIGRGARGGPFGDSLLAADDGAGQVDVSQDDEGSGLIPDDVRETVGIQARQQPPR